MTARPPTWPTKWAKFPECGPLGRVGPLRKNKPFFHPPPRCLDFKYFSRPREQIASPAHLSLHTRGTAPAAYQTKKRRSNAMAPRNWHPEKSYERDTASAFGGG